MDPSDTQFREVFSYRRYRLLQRNVQIGPEVSLNLGLWTLLLEYAMGKYVFNGTKLVDWTQLDNEGVPEAVSLKV